MRRLIKPVTITVKMTACMVNENGTLSGFTIKSVKGPNSTCRAVTPPMSAGAVFVKVDTLEKIKVKDFV
jgi:hypothetical protein